MKGDATYTVSFDPGRDLVRAKLTGAITVEIVSAMAIETRDVGRNKNCCYFLVDYTETHALDSIIDIFKFSSKLEALGIKHTDVIAIVVATDLEKHSFAETVSHNRGYQNLRYFSDVGAAEAWIEQQHAPKKKS